MPSINGVMVFGFGDVLFNVSAYSETQFSSGRSVLVDFVEVDRIGSAGVVLSIGEHGDLINAPGAKKIGSMLFSTQASLDAVIAMLRAAKRFFPYDYNPIGTPYSDLFNIAAHKKRRR